MKFQELYQKQGAPFNGGSLLSLDPGHTTGWAYWEDDNLVEFGQIKTKDMHEGIDNLTALIDRLNPPVVVFEDYRVYKWKSKQHEWSELHTPKLIGAIQTICYQLGIEHFKQPAHIAKTFATDKKLKEWDFWIEGQPHCRDAIRHGIYFLLFGEVKGKHKAPTNTVG